MKGVAAPRLYVAALGPQMLRLTGKVADGTVLWMTGTETIRNHTLPVLREAAEAADRPQPRVLAGIPVVCTDDIADTRAAAAEQFAVYGQLPSYRAMLDREGLSGPEDFAVIGDESHVPERLAEFVDAGVDTVMAVEYGIKPEDAQRTRSCLAGLL